MRREYDVGGLTVKMCNHETSSIVPDKHTTHTYYAVRKIIETLKCNANIVRFRCEIAPFQEMTVLVYCSLFNVIVHCTGRIHLVYAQNRKNQATSVYCGSIYM